MENLSCETHENIVYQKLKHFDDVIFRVIAYGIRVSLYDMSLCDLIPNICFCHYRFEKYRSSVLYPSYCFLVCCEGQLLERVKQ